MAVRIAALLASLALALAVAACGGSSGSPEAASGPTFEDVLAAIDGLSGDARAERLAELAEAEGGELDFYTSAPSVTADGLAKAFEGAYDVKVALYRASSPAVGQRLLEESEAGFHGADAVYTTGIQIAGLGRREILFPYESEYRDALPKSAVQGAAWSPVAIARLVVGWNTELVGEDERPASWEDLADPRWQGKLAMDPSDLDWYKGLFDYWTTAGGKSEEEAQSLFERIAANAVFVDGHTLGAQLLGAGEFELGVNFSNVLDTAAADGAPVGWQPAVEPLVSALTGTALVEGAQHPAAAVLFVDWLLTDGQQVIADTNQTPVVAGLDENGPLHVFVDTEGLVDEADQWAERFDRLVRLGGTFEQAG